MDMPLSPIFTGTVKLKLEFYVAHKCSELNVSNYICIDIILSRQHWSRNATLYILDGHTFVVLNFHSL